MNTFRDLLHCYAPQSGLVVDDREWLMLLELDPGRAARAMAQLAILAAEDVAIGLATQAVEAIDAATERAEAATSHSSTAAADLAAFAERLATARQRAWAVWADRVVPLLRDAGVLHRVRQAGVSRPPRTWAAGTVTLGHVGGGYRAQVATRRRRAGRPIVRVDADTCRRIAADLSATCGGDSQRSDLTRLAPATILVDADRPILVVGADDLEQAWRRGAVLVHVDADGLYRLDSRHWPWRLDRIADVEPAASATRRGRPAQSCRRRLVPAPNSHGWKPELDPMASSR